eukprot:7377468-Prymnesium_polylepis.2
MTGLPSLPCPRSVAALPAALHDQRVQLEDEQHQHKIGDDSRVPDPVRTHLIHTAVIHSVCPVFGAEVFHEYTLCRNSEYDLQPVGPASTAAHFSSRRARTAGTTSALVPFLPPSCRTLLTRTGTLASMPIFGVTCERTKWSSK